MLLSIPVDGVFGAMVSIETRNCLLLSTSLIGAATQIPFPLINAKPKQGIDIFCPNDFLVHF
jgi:hypothetical protein